MLVKYNFAFVLLFSFRLAMSSQRVSFKNNLQTISSRSCQRNPGALVEHFFNLILSEFRESPPLCVCVNMCLNQPTYCFPNGCLKVHEFKKKQENTTTEHPLIHRRGRQDNLGEPSSPMRMQAKEEKSERKSFYNDLVTKVNDHRQNKMETDDQKLVTPNSYRPKLFRDNKNFLQYKKKPTVEFRYNLRERVKNMKADRQRLELLHFTRHWPLVKSNIAINVKQKNQTNEKLTVFDKIDDPKTYKRALPNEDIETERNDTKYSLSQENLDFSLDKLLDKLTASVEREDVKKENEDLNKDSYELVNTFNGQQENISTASKDVKNINSDGIINKYNGTVFNSTTTVKNISPEIKNITNSVDANMETQNAKNSKKKESVQEKKSGENSTVHLNVLKKKGRQKINISRPQGKIVNIR